MEDCMKPVEAMKEHLWLTRLVGEWKYECSATMGPGQPEMKFGGRDVVRSLGGLWIICEGEGDTPGGGMAQMRMTIGYDPAKKRFVGNFIASMMTHMWVYDGGLDASEKVLTLDTLGPSFTEPGKMVRYQDIIEVISDDKRLLRSQGLGPDGKWMPFMRAEYTRTK